MKTTIKKATVEDIEIVAGLAIQMWNTHTLEELKQEFLDAMNKESNTVFLALSDEGAVGFAQCGLRHDYVEGTASSPVGYLEGIFVAEEYRKRGLAKDMLEACQSWAKKQGCTEFASDCELENEESLEFHLKMGFEEANRIICFTKKLIDSCDAKIKLLFGTGNQAKLSAMKSRLEKIGIELIGLSDLRKEGKTIPEVRETGDTPLENARLKALAYYEAFRMPVFSCDSGLYFDDVPDEVQPGVHVRNVNGKCLSDEEMMEYYAGLVRQYGNLMARYKNAISFVMDETHIYESMDPSMDSEKFILTDKPHSAIRKKGFPLDSMSIDVKTNQYYYDLPADELEQFAVEDGVLQFFEKIRRSCFQNVLPEGNR